MATGYIFTTTDNTALFIDAFFAPRFDQHVRVYRRHQYIEKIKADCARSEAHYAQMAAGLRALRSRKLFAEG